MRAAIERLLGVPVLAVLPVERMGVGRARLIEGPLGRAAADP